jgi:hypothetical protein
VFRVYKIMVVFDRTRFNEVWIDPHYEEKHRESITDELILRLIQMLGVRTTMPDAEIGGFRYYEIDVTDRMKCYRLILVRPSNDSYLGVQNVYRRST